MLFALHSWKAFKKLLDRVSRFQRDPNEAKASLLYSISSLHPFAFRLSWSRFQRFNDSMIHAYARERS